MADLPLHILTDAGFSGDEANTIVQGLLDGTNLHTDGDGPSSLNLEALPAEKKDAIERFNLAVAADA